VPFWFKKEKFSHNSLQKALIKIMIQALLRVNLGFIYTFNLTMRFHTRSLPCPLKKYCAPIRSILRECGILKECKNTIPNHTEK
jgi:hypothetical protein